MEKTMTMKEMCEVISKHWEEKHDTKETPENIFNYSPTGELVMVFVWYEEATNHHD